MKYQTLLFLFCLLSSTQNSAYAQGLSEENDALLSGESAQDLFLEAYLNAKHILQQNGQEGLPPLWQDYKPQVLDWKKLACLVNFFVEFTQTSQDFNKSTRHSIKVCSEDVCSSAPCLLCDYEYDPDRPKADGPCTKGLCNCMWIAPTSLAAGFFTMFRTLSSFLWCGPCGVYVSLGLGTCAGAAGGVAIACVPTCIKAARKRLKEHKLQTKLEDSILEKDRIRSQFADIVLCPQFDPSKLIADLEFLKKDPVMNLILNFYSSGAVSSVTSSPSKEEYEPLI